MTRRLWRPGAAGAEMLLATAVVALGAAIGTAGLRLAGDARDEAVCMEHLRRISVGLQRYRAERHALPPALSSLYPRYVSDRSVFLCPLTRRYVRTADQRAELAKVFSDYDYMYQFTNRASHTPLDQREPGDPVQMYYTWGQVYKIGGERLPIVTCHLHDPYLTRPGQRRGNPWIRLVLRLDGRVEKSARRVQDQPHRILAWWAF